MAKLVCNDVHSNALVLGLSLVEDTHWATHRQSILSTQRSCACTQNMPFFFKSCFAVSNPFFLHLSGLGLVVFASQCNARLISESTIVHPRPPKPLSLLSLIISSICRAVFTLATSFRTLSFQETPSILRWNVWCAASNLFLVWQTEATVLHCRTLLTEPAIRTVSLWVSG